MYVTNQGIVAEINLAIGASGVISNECKMIVQEYGDQIIELLLAQVQSLADSHFGDRNCFTFYVI
jgi:hypothetical protein